MVSPGRNVRGFSLVEALIATVLGTLVIALVVSVVVAQGGYFGDVHARANLQETVRSSADLLREELQTVLRGGILTAESDRLVVLVPVAIGVICGEVVGPPGKGKAKGKGPVTGAPAYLPLPGGGAGTDRVTWYAIRDENGDWLFHDSNPVVTGGNPTGACQAVGADTDGAKGDFRNLSGLQSPALPELGNLVALLSEVGFRFDDSALGPGTIALYRQEAGGAEVEFASGLDADARFQYRREGQPSFQDQVTSAADRATIVEIRVFASARSLDERRGTGALSYEWDLRIPLRNVP
jgi:hypothetical protein